MVAAAFVAAMRRDGISPDPALRLLAWVRHEHPEPIDLPTGPDALGHLHEHAVPTGERVRRGAWYTPRWLADDLVGRAMAAVDRPVARVADLSCGGGVFLLAAADQLATRESPADVVGMLFGRDTDPLAVAVTEAALWWWSVLHGEPTLPGDRLAVGDALVGITGAERTLPMVDVVVGNPPFLGQLRTSTAASTDRRSELRTRFGDVLRPYTDEAWLFLLTATELVADGGVVAMVQPSAVLGARDAGPVRAAVDARADLVDCWIDDGSTFDAAIQACAPVLRIGRRRRGVGANDWTGSLAERVGTPMVDLRAGPCLGGLAHIVAGFRDEYYGLVDAVHEGGDGVRLVTSGAIDPFRHRDDVAVRFAKRRWTDPRVRTESVTGRAARWLDVQTGPKLLVATQTRVLEAAMDETGELVGSVPTIVVRPHDPDDLWRVAAAIHAPAVSAWALRRSAGTALSNDACKPTAALLKDMPLPTDDGAWNEAARLARQIAGGGNGWERFAEAADRAYGVADPDVRDWWLARLPLR